VIAGEGLPVEVACRVLGVSGSGYYAAARGAARLVDRRHP
jgi:hypothetical protein